MNQTWWNDNLSKPENMDIFKKWIGDQNAQSKVLLRQYIASKKYSSILDVGCGVATEYDGYKNDGYPIDYKGVDSCSILVKSNIARGVPMIEANCENIPLEDKSIDIVYSRHVLEHQPSFKGILNEMIRLAKYEAIHVFFIIPGPLEIISYDSIQNLYHNRYNINDIIQFLQTHPRVDKFTFNPINKDEASLHILVK
jgi:ubiquinone/menaquinone biosynthesis C-methylase UbiE